MIMDNKPKKDYTLTTLAYTHIIGVLLSFIFTMMGMFMGAMLVIIIMMIIGISMFLEMIFGKIE